MTAAAVSLRSTPSPVTARSSATVQGEGGATEQYLATMRRSAGGGGSSAMIFYIIAAHEHTPQAVRMHVRHAR